VLRFLQLQQTSISPILSHFHNNGKERRKEERRRNPSCYGIKPKLEVFEGIKVRGRIFAL